jgi:hypothetical protein
VEMKAAVTEHGDERRAIAAGSRPTAPPDDEFAIVRGFLLAVLLVVPFWLAASFVAFVVLF